MPLVKNRERLNATAPADVEQTMEALLGDLVSPDPKLRRSGARGLGRHPRAAGVLGIALRREALESVRASIFTALMRIGTKSTAADLVELLQSEDAGLRNGAMEALKSMPEFAAECLGEIFAGVADIRIFGIEILGELSRSLRIYWLRRVVEEENEINVCAVAADTLVKRGDHDAVTPLLRLRERFPDEPFIEFSVCSAVARIGTL